jgi:2-methylisocitrate lyase-like PEP mutase family enzyme
MKASNGAANSMVRLIALILLVVVQRIEALGNQCPADNLLNLLSSSLESQRARALGVYGVHDALSAKILDQQIPEDNPAALFVSGFGVSAARLGQPDAGILTLTELKDSVQSILPLVTGNKPVIVDGDTGFGGPSNMRRMIRDMASLGAAAITIEDQCFPKRCTYVAGTEVTVLDRSEAKRRMQLALAAQSEAYEQDGNKILVIARTDCRMQLELGVEEAIERCLIFEELGADIAYAENLQSEEEYRRLRNCIAIPMILAQVQTGAPGQKLWTLDDIYDMGYDMGLYGISGLQATVRALETAAAEILKSGGLISTTPLSTLEQVKAIVGFDELDAFERQAYLDDDTSILLLDNNKSIDSSYDSGGSDETNDATSAPDQSLLSSLAVETGDSEGQTEEEEKVAVAAMDAPTKRIIQGTVVEDDDVKEEEESHGEEDAAMCTESVAQTQTTPSTAKKEETQSKGRDFFQKLISKKLKLMDVSDRDIDIADVIAEAEAALLAADKVDTNKKPSQPTTSTTNGKKSFFTGPQASTTYGQTMVGYFPSKSSGRAQTALRSSKNGDKGGDADNAAKEGPPDEESPTTSSSKLPLPKFGTDAKSSFPKSPFAKTGLSSFGKSKTGKPSPFASPKGSTSDDKPSEDGPKEVPSEPTSTSFPKSDGFSQAKKGSASPATKTSPFAPKTSPKGFSREGDDVKEMSSESKSGKTSFQNFGSKQPTGSPSPFAKKGASSFSQPKMEASVPATKSPFTAKTGPKGLSSESDGDLKETVSEASTGGKTSFPKFGSKQASGSTSPFAKKGVSSFSQPKTESSVPATKSPFTVKTGPKGSSSESYGDLKETVSEASTGGKTSFTKFGSKQASGSTSPSAKKGVSSFSQPKMEASVPATKSPFTAKTGPKGSSSESYGDLKETVSEASTGGKTSFTKFGIKQASGSTSPFAKKGVSSFTQPTQPKSESSTKSSTFVADASPKGTVAPGPATKTSPDNDL